MAKMNELMEKLEAAETVEDINEVKAEIVAEKERQEVIAEKSAILDSFKAEKPVEAKSEPEPKTLGEYMTVEDFCAYLDAEFAKAAK